MQDAETENDGCLCAGGQLRKGKYQDLPLRADMSVKGENGCKTCSTLTKK